MMSMPKRAELVLHRGEARLGGGELVDGDHDADVLLEHVPVGGDHRHEEPAVQRRLRQVHPQPGGLDDVVQERLRQRGQQILLVLEVPIEQPRRLTAAAVISASVVP
jgi:hypothetical protein